MSDQEIALTVELNVFIETFRAIGNLKGNIKYRMELVSPPPGKPGKIVVVFTPPHTITLKAADDFSGNVRLVYTLVDRENLLVGIGFADVDTPIVSGGVLTFPCISFDRSTDGANWKTVMTVDDTIEARDKKIYSYSIYAQNIPQSAIGILDPIIENEPN
jgi:hypothetical protein